MKFNIFYSWQSDLSNSTNRNPIEEAIKRAVRKLDRDEVEMEIALDRDTKGVEGSPNISDIIFDKISKSKIFICDISIINSGSDKDKKCPNPNVLIELGFAIKTLSDRNVICVLNEEYGNEKELPFDLNGRRILKYDSRKPDFKSNLFNSIELSILAIIKRYKTQNTIIWGRGNDFFSNDSDKNECLKMLESLPHQCLIESEKNEVRISIQENTDSPMLGYLYFALPSKLERVEAYLSGLGCPIVRIGKNILFGDSNMNVIEYDLYRFYNATNGHFDTTIKFTLKS